MSSRIFDRNQIDPSKMKMIVAVTLALVAVIAAAPVEEVPQTLKSDFNQSPEGNFNYVFETSNGINAQAEGAVKQLTDSENKPVQVVIFRGSYSYPGEDGKPIVITYLADENGFQPEGESIPKNN